MKNIVACQKGSELSANFPWKAGDCIAEGCCLKFILRLISKEVLSYTTQYIAFASLLILWESKREPAYNIFKLCA